MKSKTGLSRQGLSILVAGAITLLTAGCTGLFGGKLFKERAAETPPPDETVVDKSFFQDPSGKPKTFMCAWAPEVGQGYWGEKIEPFVNGSSHCNIEFEITQDFVIGKMINPSFPHDRSRWKEWLKIPIAGRKHFYYEREKDSHGRETNRWIENDSRSHWSARPKIRLDLAGITVHDTGIPGWGEFRTSAVSDVEWDFEHNFLAFSTDTVFHNDLFGDNPELQLRFRFNFMQYEHDPTFKTVPYHQENSQYMNVLHIMGHEIEGRQPELFAAHWDLRKTQNLYLNGVPKELEKTVIGAIYKWNYELQEAGVVPKGQLAFAPIIKNLKHPFDLRYPSITWISDRRISANGPLGIGMASADVSNGKILWGSVIMFGGVLDYYINAYTPGENSSGGGSSTASKLLSPVHAIASLLPAAFHPMKEYQHFNPALREQFIRNMGVDYTNFLTGEITKLSGNREDKAQADLADLKRQLLGFQSKDPQLNKIVADLLEKSGEHVLKAEDYFKTHKVVTDILGNTGARGTMTAQQTAEAKGDTVVAALLKQQDPQHRDEILHSIRPATSPFFIEKDYTIENLLGGILASPARKSRTYPEMLDSVVMHLTLHEFGHFLGLGHQFKENIVPEEGTVPSRYVKELAAQADKEHNFGNESSVMGYRDGGVEMMKPADQLKPGPHDDLVIKYLYRGLYSSYDPKADDYVFTEVPSSGKIPEYSMVKTKSGQTENLKTSYFPQCNDIEASLGADPFCNRWDRGSKAEDIVKGYFEHISDNLLANLYSLVGGGSDAELAEGRLWYMALESFSRVRMFYDEMRRELRSEPHLKPLWNQLRADKDALFEFSKACQESDPTDPRKVESDVLRKIFADKKMVDLCRANAVALDEFGFFLNLPESDYTKMDHDRRYISGGYLAGDAAVNQGHIFGSWYQLSNLPLKFSALYSLVESTPHLLWNGYLLNNPYYDNPENKYLYRTLYPRKYTELISDTVLHNMAFAANGTDERTTMGRAILAAGVLLPQQRDQSNEAGRLRGDYTDMLNQQTQFEQSMVAVLIEAQPQPAGSKKNEPDRYKKFTAKIYDFISGQSYATRDVFVLPRGQVFVWANGMFIFPITKMKFYGNLSSYVIAYKVSYDYEAGDRLIETSVKSALLKKHNEIAEACTNGFDGHGLISYFTTSNDEFRGFKIPLGIANEGGKEKLELFYKSIDEEFARYETKVRPSIPPHFPLKDMQSICDETLRGVGQISASASLINGYWLGITGDYMEH
jgi:hypothetical protein